MATEQPLPVLHACTIEVSLPNTCNDTRADLTFVHGCQVSFHLVFTGAPFGPEKTIKNIELPQLVYNNT